MGDILTIACTPLDEPCVQILDTMDYSSMMRKEVTIFKNQLERLKDSGHFGPVQNAYFKVTSSPHDFGTYYDVEVVWNDDNEIDTEFVFKVEENIPLNWDEEAKKELGEEYFKYLEQQNKH